MLHTKYGLPHVVITSVSLPLDGIGAPPGGSGAAAATSRSMSVVGSTRTSTGQARLFGISFPVFDCYFSGTGDMFAALMVVRMREAVHHAGEDLQRSPSWLSGDNVDTRDLPLAKAAEKVLASMHEVLSQTCASMQANMKRDVAELETQPGLTEEEMQKKLHLIRSRNAELRLVRNLGCLRSPDVEYRAFKLE